MGYGSESDAPPRFRAFALAAGFRVVAPKSRNFRAFTHTVTYLNIERAARRVARRVAVGHGGRMILAYQYHRCASILFQCSLTHISSVPPPD